MMPNRSRVTSSRTAAAALCLAAVAAPMAQAVAFCGFYVAQADATLFNTASKVVLAWDNGRAAVTMASDYKGDPKEFALVIPVPTVVKEQDIRVVDPQAGRQARRLFGAAADRIFRSRPLSASDGVQEPDRHGVSRHARAGTRRR